MGNTTEIPSLLFGTAPNTPFPPVDLALKDPNGLLAVGGDLSSERLLNAYRKGIFPWYSEDQPILWWSPDPRLVLFPETFRPSRSLRKTIAKDIFGVTANTAFDEVVCACSEPRINQSGTWIVDDIKNAYRQLHDLGHAHSVEAWYKGELVGGLYGVSIGKVFFGESMFSRVTDASKVAFAWLVERLRQRQFGLIDCQVETAHLKSLGAVNISRDEFIALLQKFCEQPARFVE